MIIDTFYTPGSITYIICMNITSYMFVLEFFMVLIFTTVSCSMFGSEHVLLTIKKDDDSYAVLVEGRASKRK